jgi:hypothetical protein
MNKPDLNNQLEALRKLAANRSPYYAWKAIETCIKRKKEFPEWVKEYLVGCAERMQSDRAARAGDTRKQLSWIFEREG